MSSADKPENDFELPEIELKFDDEEIFSDKPKEDDELLNSLTASLGQQVSDELGVTDEGEEAPEDGDDTDMQKNKKKKRTVLKVLGIILLIIMAFLVWLVATESGRKFAIRMGVEWFWDDIGSRLTPAPGDGDITPAPGDEAVTPEPTSSASEVVEKGHRTEDYVTNYLLMGIEEIYGASNTDSMMIVTINTKDSTVKVTSLLRDTLVSIPGYEKRNKLNAVYARGGEQLLIDTIENTYDIEIQGWAHVNFSAFEAIVDLIGGVDIELGEKEAAYLCKENYISNPEYRTVVAGWNHLNGNQALGYCRVRKVVTLGGANNDYGRTVRQRRVVTAIFNKLKDMGFMDLISLMRECLGYVQTNLTASEITDAISMVVENRIFDIETTRLPMDEMFYDSGSAGIEGITYALVIDDYYEETIAKFHQFIFLDPVPTEVPENTPTPNAAP